MVRVSIIIPVYNNREDILDAIKSVQIQTYTDWELIIVDDCSVDDIFPTIKEYLCANIHFIQLETNRGTYVALNEGLKIAKGEYISILGSDDTYIPTKLHDQVEFLDNNPTIVKYVQKSRRDNIIRYSEAASMFRKNIIDKIGYFDSVRIAADTEFLERVEKMYPSGVRFNDDIVYIAKTRSNSLTTSEKWGLVGEGWKLRKAYLLSFREWHKRSNNLYIPYPLKWHERPFKIPEKLKI